MIPELPALKQSFPPVVDARTRILVLGSLPGEVSLAQQQYYAHPTNQFWRLISAVAGHDLVPLPYDQRLSGLLAAQVGVWDVIKSARRDGSLDGNIRDHEPNSLRDLVDTLSELRAIAFNGGTAAAIGRRQLGVVNRVLVSLPSSSAAYTMSFDRKLLEWLKLKVFL